MDLHIENRFEASYVNIEPGERWLTGIGGAVLAAAGLAKRSFGGLLMVLGGGYLIYRAVRGYCPVYNLLGIEPGGDEEMLPADAPPPPGVEYGDEVIEASWESFPTSDPPSWTMGVENNGA